MPKTRGSYKRREDKAEVNQEKVDASAEFPYQRRYFTKPRQAKTNKFLVKSAADPKLYGIVESKLWFTGLLRAINEPGIVTTGNIRDWISSNPQVFHPQIDTPPKPRFTQKKPPSHRDVQVQVKREVKQRVFQDLEEHQSSSGDLFEAVKIKRRVIIKTEINDEDSIQELPSHYKRIKKETFKVEKIVDTLDSIETEEQIPYFNIATPSPVLSCANLEKTELANAETNETKEESQKLEPSTTVPEIKPEVTKVEAKTESTEISVDSGVQSLETVQPGNEQVMIPEIPESQVFSLNSQDFIKFANSVGSFEVLEFANPTSPSVFLFHALDSAVVPDERITTLQENLSKYSKVMEALNLLVRAFEDWHGFLIEPRNSGASEIFDCLRKCFDELENGYIKYVMNAPDLDDSKL